jgi:uncharacterized HAD superfamily protein
MQSVLSTLRIGFDLDGVLAHSDAAAVAHFKRHGLVPPETTADDVTEYDYSQCFEQVTGDFWRDMYRIKGFFLRMAADGGAINLVQDLVTAGVEVHIVTHRDWRPANRAETVEWLKFHQCPYHRLEFRTPDQKPHYAEQYRLDFFFEDHPQTAHRMAAAATLFPRVSFLRDKPYNRGVADTARLMRFYCWPEIGDFFKL